MWEQVGEFAQSPIAALLGLGLGALGVGLAIYFYVKGKRRKELCFFQSSRTLFSKSKAALEGLDILYKGATQEQVTITKLTLWNSGTETVLAEDVSLKAPLVVLIDTSATVLDYSTIGDDSSPFSLELLPSDESNHRIAVKFEYLDAKDGGAIQIVHNGSASTTISMTGKVKGGNGPKGIDPLVARRPKMFGPILYLANSKLFAWFGVAVYAGAATWLLARGISQSFSIPYLAGSAVCILGSFVMYTGYAKEQVPTRFLRDV